MNIEQLLKQYKELQFDPMEDPTGLNEEKEAKIEKDPTKEIKVVEPEIDGDSVCKKLLKKLESVQPDSLDEKCGDKKDKKDKKEKELDEDITTFGTKLDDVNKQLKELINSLTTTNEEIEESCGDKKKKKAKKIHEEKPGYMAVEDFEINGVWELIKPYLDKEGDEYILYAGEFQALIDDIMTETEDATSENIEKLQQCLGEYYDQLLEEELENIKIVDSEIGGLDESCCGGDKKKKKTKKKSKKQESVSEAELVNLQDNKETIKLALEKVFADINQWAYPYCDLDTLRRYDEEKLLNGIPNSQILDYCRQNDITVFIDKFDMEWISPVLSTADLEDYVVKDYEENEGINYYQDSEESLNESELVNLQDKDTKLLSDEQIAGQYKNFKCTHAEVQESKVNEDWFNVTLELEFPNAEHEDFDDYVIENLYYNRKDDKWGFDHWYPEEVVEEIKTLALAKIAEFEAHKNESLNKNEEFNKSYELPSMFGKFALNDLITYAGLSDEQYEAKLPKIIDYSKRPYKDRYDAPVGVNTKFDPQIDEKPSFYLRFGGWINQYPDDKGEIKLMNVDASTVKRVLEFIHRYKNVLKDVDFSYIKEQIEKSSMKEGLIESLNEELDKDVHYNFTIDKIAADTLKLTSGESEFEVYIRPEDDLQDIRYAIEDFVDGELVADEDDAENITGTEVVGFKYDIESGKGEFEATIFFDGDMDESCKKVKKNRKKMTEEEVLYDIYCDGELEDDKGRNAEYIIGFVNDIIDNMNDGIPEDEQVEHVGTLQQAKKVGKTLQWTFPLHKMNESLNEEVVAKFDEGKHEIVKCKEGYYNRYNIKEGKARFTTKCMESLPTAMSALKKRYPKAEEVKV